MNNAEKRAVEIMQYVYDNISPHKNNKSRNPAKILSEGYAWCLGYSLVLDYLLKKAKFKTRLVSVVSKINKTDLSHELVEVKIKDKYWLFDPTTNKYFKHSLCDILKNEKIIDIELKKRYNLVKDKRWKTRKYADFCSTKYYKETYKVGLRTSRFIPIRLVLKSREHYEKHICNR